MKNIVYLCVLTPLIISCGKSKPMPTPSNDTITISIDTSVFANTVVNNTSNFSLAIEEEIIMKEDTLSIISDSEFLYYPFGKHISFQKLSNIGKELKINYLQKPNEMRTTLYTSQNDTLETLLNTDTQLIEIVRATIKDTNIVLEHSIKIGISKETFFNNLGILNNDEYQSITVIELVSTLTGIWHYYNFGIDNTLNLISLKTDYFFDY